MRYISFFVFSLLIITRVKGQSSDLRLAKLDSMFNEAFSKDLWNGNVLIAEKGNILYQKSFGKADRQKGLDLNNETIFELASVTKQFTAMGIMILVKDGKISFADSLRKFFPELPYTNITVRQLLNHTSGLPDYMDLFNKHWDSSQIATNADVISLLAKHAPDTVFAPGSRWEYSNTGYVLLASIIEKVSGKSYAEFLKKNIFEPLDMKRTLVMSRRYDKKMPDNYALGYVFDPLAQEYILPDDHPALGTMVYTLDGIHGDGCVNSTTTDLFRWHKALYTGKLVPLPMINEAFQPSQSRSGSHPYGFGWGIIEAGDYGKVVNHSGGWPGYSTYLERHLDNDKLIIFLQNNGKRLPKVDDVRRVLYGMEVKQVVEMPVSKEEILHYVGVYELMPSFKLTVTEKDGRIYVQATGQPAFEIFREKEDLFFVKAVEAKLLFIRNEQKKVNAVTLYQGGQQVTGRKIE